MFRDLDGHIKPKCTCSFSDGTTVYIYFNTGGGGGGGGVMVSLHWRHMSVVVSQISHNSTLFLINCSNLQLKSPHPIGGSTSHRTKKLQWRHNGRDSVSNHQPHDCLLNLLFRRRSKKSSKLRLTGLYAGNSPGTGEFPAQMAILAENISIWRRHRDMQSVSVSILLWNAFWRHQRALHTTTQAHH